MSVCAGRCGAGYIVLGSISCFGIEVFFMTEGIIALIVFVYENLGYIVEIVEIVETGKKIIQIFTDDDGDGEPDTPELPFFEIDPEEQTAVEKSIIIMNSDGTMTIYDEEYCQTIDALSYSLGYMTELIAYKLEILNYLGYGFNLSEVGSDFLK